MHHKQFTMNVVVDVIAHTDNEDQINCTIDAAKHHLENLLYDDHRLHGTNISSIEFGDAQDVQKSGIEPQI